MNRRELLADLKTAKAHGLRVIGYTHHWRRRDAQHLRGLFLASCSSYKAAQEAWALGWDVALAVRYPGYDPDKPFSFSSANVFIPPGMRLCKSYDLDLQCVSCGMCVRKNLNKQGFRGVVFPAHGVGASRVPILDVGPHSFGCDEDGDIRRLPMAGA